MHATDAQWGKQYNYIKQFDAATCMGGPTQRGSNAWSLDPLHGIASCTLCIFCTVSACQQARKLENALDVKLGQFAKLSSGYEQSYSRGEGGLATDQVILLLRWKKPSCDAISREVLCPRLGSRVSCVCSSWTLRLLS